MIEISKAVIQKNKKFLLLKRATKSYPGLWDFAGGKDEPGETPAQSVTREVREETAFEISPGQEVKTVHYQDEKINLRFHYFAPEIISGEFKISADHSDFKWQTREEINYLELHPAVKEYFK